MNIIIAGGRGFLGQALSGRLAADGHRVLILTRHPTSAGQPWNGARSEHSWTPDGTAGNWASVIEGADAVVNLAGESIAEGRWTDARKQVILESRVRATRSLELAIAQAHRRPAVLVSASAQGYYGDRADDELTEDAEPGNDFLAEVCWEWETEARKAEALTASSCCERASSSRRAGCAAGHDPAVQAVRRRAARIGPAVHVVDPPGRLGRHRNAGHHGRARQGTAKPGSPRPVRNAEFSALLGQAVNRPSRLSAPAFALRLALGEMARPLLLASIRMVPAGPLSDGYVSSTKKPGKRSAASSGRRLSAIGDRHSAGIGFRRSTFGIRGDRLSAIDIRHSAGIGFRRSAFDVRHSVPALRLY